MVGERENKAPLTEDDVMKDVDSDKRDWRKVVGRGSYTHKDGQVVHLGGILRGATEDEIRHFRKFFEPLQPLPTEEDYQEAQLSLEMKGGGWYNVVKGDGTVLNKKALRIEEAQALLSAETPTATKPAPKRTSKKQRR
jgi:hypothetical protein